MVICFSELLVAINRSFVCNYCICLPEHEININKRGKPLLALHIQIAYEQIPLIHISIYLKIYYERPTNAQIRDVQTLLEAISDMT